MSTPESIAFHEAGHVVVAWYFGWTPTSVTLASDTVKHGQATHDRTGFLETLPGGGLIQTLVNTCVCVLELAAGGCAELRFGTEHDECGWSGDYLQFQPMIRSVAKICGYTYDHCWDLLSAMTKEILAQADVWPVVEALATLLLERHALERHELQSFFRAKAATMRDERIAVLLGFVSTLQAQVVAARHAAGLDV